MILASEFAQVGVELDVSGNGPRLRIEDLKTGHVGYLDPLELETLAWATKEELAPLFDPAASRWKAISADDFAGLAAESAWPADAVPREP